LECSCKYHITNLETEKTWVTDRRKTTEKKRNRKDEVKTNSDETLFHIINTSKSIFLQGQLQKYHWGGFKMHYIKHNYKLSLTTMFCSVIELNLMIKTCDMDVHVHIWLVCICINDVEMKSIKFFSITQRFDVAHITLSYISQFQVNWTVVGCLLMSNVFKYINIS